MIVPCNFEVFMICFLSETHTTVSPLIKETQMIKSGLTVYYIKGLILCSYVYQILHLP